MDRENLLMDVFQAFVDVGRTLCVEGKEGRVEKWGVKQVLAEMQIMAHQFSKVKKWNEQHLKKIFKDTYDAGLALGQQVIIDHTETPAILVKMKIMYGARCILFARAPEGMIRERERVLLDSIVKVGDAAYSLDLHFGVFDHPTEIDSPFCWNEFEVALSRIEEEMVGTDG